MDKKVCIILITFLLCFHFIDKSQLTTGGKIPLKQALVVGVIHVTSDDDFVNYTFEGDGSEENPFRIDNLIIDSQIKGGIYISDISKYVRIQNCTIYSKQFGILIRSVFNSTVIIRDNFCNVKEVDYSGSGISIYNSDKTEITNNTCVNCPYGMYIGNGDSLLISKNNISHNLWGGVYLYGLTNSVVEKNFCYNNSVWGIWISGSYNVVIEQNICVNNTVREEYALGYYDVEGIGIAFGSSEYCVIENNICSFNGIAGIEVSWSKFMIVYNNTVESNSLGIAINIDIGHSTFSTAISLVYNYIKNSIQYGIYFGRYVRICNAYANILIDNNKQGVYDWRTDELYSSQAYDQNKKKNKWYDVSTKTGNYWSDGENVTVYEIDGEAESKSPFPIIDLAQMDIPVLPDFPKAMWFHQGGFYSIRITFTFLTPIIVIIVVFIRRKLLRKPK